MISGLTSRKLLSASLATKGNAAITSGTMDATVPTVVPTMTLVRGITIIIRIRKGMERSRFIITLSTDITGFGRGRMPFLSPAAKRTPRGRPMTMARAVARTVTYTVSQRASGNSL